MKRLLLFLVLLLVTGCTQNGSGTPPTTPDNSLKFPTVRLGQIEGATSVYTNSIIHLVFSKPLYDMQYFYSTIELINLDTNTTVYLDYTLAQDKVTLSLVPSSFNYTTPIYLDANTSYSIVLRPELMFADYSALGQEFTYEFQTGENSDNNASIVLAQNIVDGDTNLSIHAAFVYRFNETLDATNASYTLNGDSNVSCSLGTDGRTLMCVPYAPLPFGANLTLDITGLKDMANNSMTLSHTATTQTAPAVTDTLTDINATGVAALNPNNGTLYYVYQNPMQMDATLKYAPSTEGQFGAQSALTSSIALNDMTLYNNALFLIGSEALTYITLDGNTTPQSISTNAYNISTAALNADRACLISNSNNIFYFYKISKDTSYSMNSLNEIANSLSGSLFSPNKCAISDERIAYVSSQSGLYKFDVTNTIATNLAYINIPTADFSIAKNRLAVTSNTFFTLYDDSNWATPLSVIDLNVTLGQVEIYGSYAFVLKSNSSTISVIDIQIPASPVIVSTLSASHTIKSFAFHDHYLYTFGQTNDTNATASQIIDIGAYAFGPYEDATLLHSVNKVRAYPQMGNTLIAAGSMLSLLNAKGETYLSGNYEWAPIYNFNMVQDGNETLYLMLAQGYNGFSIAQFGRDTNGLPNALQTNLTFNPSANVMSILGGRIGADFHLYVGTTEGLLHYTIDTTNWSAPTLISSDTTNFGALFDMVSNNGTKVYVADYSKHAVGVLALDANGSYTLSNRFDVNGTPRALHIDINTGHVFAALGEGGVLAINSNDYASNQLISLPDYIMDVATGSNGSYETNTSYSLLATGLNTVSSMTFDANSTFLGNFADDGVLDYARGGLYSGQFLSQLNPYDANATLYSINGAMSFNRYGYTRLWGHLEMPRSFDEILYANAPLLSIEFNTTTSSTQDELAQYYDPFF